MIQIDQETCSKCGMCMRDCISRALYMQDGKLCVDNRCLLCGHCVAICPTAAIQLPDPAYCTPVSITPSLPRLEPDTFLNAVKCRRSIRNYKPLPISDDIVHKLLETAAYTASAKNARDLKFIFIQDKLPEFRELVFQGIEQQIRSAASSTEPASFWLTQLKNFYQNKNNPPEDEMLFRNAPAVLYLLSESQADAALAAQNIEMMACACGLGAMYNGYLRRITSSCPKAMEFLRAEDRNIGICMLLGYPAVTYKRTPPRKLPDHLLL